MDSGPAVLESSVNRSAISRSASFQEIVSYYSKTPERPAGINLDDEFPLPAGIREIQVEPGHAIVVQ